MGRTAVGIELKPDYFRDGVFSMKLPAEGGEAGAVRLGGSGRKANSPPTSAAHRYLGNRGCQVPADRWAAHLGRGDLLARPGVAR